jgi:hypothetical protein
MTGNNPDGRPDCDFVLVRALSRQASRRMSSYMSQPSSALEGTSGGREDALHFDHPLMPRTKRSFDDVRCFCSYKTQTTIDEN